MIDAIARKIAEHSDAVLKGMGKFHSSQVTGSKSCPTYSIASPVGPNQMKSFDDVTSPVGITFPLPLKPICENKEAAIPAVQPPIVRCGFAGPSPEVGYAVADVNQGRRRC